MNIKDIYNLKEREIDKTVAEIVFEWTSICQWDHLDEKTGDLIVDDGDWIGVPPCGTAKTVEFEGSELRTIEFLPYYSTKSDDALSIIHYMRDVLHYDFELRSVFPFGKGKSKWRAVFYNLNDIEPMIVDGVGYIKHAITDPSDEWQWGANAKTIELAICRAAIITVIGKSKCEEKYL